VRSQASFEAFSRDSAREAVRFPIGASSFPCLPASGRRPLRGLAPCARTSRAVAFGFLRAGSVAELRSPIPSEWAPLLPTQRQTSRTKMLFAAKAA
jgi:hypothetical protein